MSVHTIQITSIASVWIAFASKASECWAVASKGNEYLVAKMIDGRWSVLYSFSTLIKAEDAIRITLQAEGLTRIECRGSLETALTAIALNEPWISFE